MLDKFYVERYYNELNYRKKVIPHGKLTEREEHYLECLRWILEKDGLDLIKR